MSTTRLLPLRDRLADKITKTESCWIWTGAKSSGYGAVRNGDGNGMSYVHRLMFEKHYGEIPAGMFIDHRCRTRDCVRPDHLQLATNSENQQNRGACRTSRTGIRGVAWNKKMGKYQASARCDGTWYYGGVFDSVDEAEQAAIALRNRLYTNNLADRAVTR